MALHRLPRFPFPHLQRIFSLTRSLFQRCMLLSHVGQNISLFSQSTHLQEFHAFFMVRKQESKKHFGRKTISAHYTAPEGSFRDEGQAPNFVLVNLDYRRERKRHVIGTKILPHFWKVYNVNMNKKLLQMPLAPASGNCRCFSPSVVALLPVHLGTLVKGKFAMMWESPTLPTISDI